MEATIVKQTPESIIIEWGDDEIGFGTLQITYTKDGKYILDAEYMGIETIIKIIKALE